MTGYAKNGTDLDALLEPWQSGDGFAAATGYKINGADLNTKYAPASVGSAYTGGTGYDDNGSDIGPRFAAKGSRVTALPINGNTYTTSVFVPAASSGNATFEFRLTSATTWDLYVQRTTGCSGSPAAGTQTSGAVPANAASVRYTPTYLGASGDTGPATVTNGAPSPTAVGANVVVGLQLGGTGTSSPKQSTYNIKVEFLNGSGVVISTTNFTAKMEAEGSA